jgi:hypothetical protein
MVTKLSDIDHYELTMHHTCMFYENKKIFLLKVTYIYIFLSTVGSPVPTVQTGNFMSEIYGKACACRKD